MPKQEYEAKVSLESITASAPRDPPTPPDSLTQLERVDLEDRRTEVVGKKQDIKERKKYALLFFGLGCAWMTAITGMLLLQGFGLVYHATFKLSDTVLLAAIGSTTVNVLGIVYVVANYLFPKR